VADRKQIKKTIKQLQRIKTWQLVILFILSCFLASTFLRLNNIGMVERRNAVISADAVGIDTITADRLYDLQRYVTAHMNTDLGKGVPLESSYKRATQKVLEDASQSSNPNGNIYVKAQQTCAPQYTRWSEAYVQCTVAALATYPAASNLISGVQFPPAAEYYRVYVSPTWSPDFAGWSVVLCIVILLLIITRIISLIVLRLLLRRHYKSI
jgi:hypothetical protein